MQRILVPIDFSTESLRALELADELLTLLGDDGEATLLFVVEAPAALGPINAISRMSQKQWRDADIQARKQLQKVSTKYLQRHSIQVATVRARKSVSEEIVDFSKTHKFTSIVLSTHGRTGIAKLILGSVTERVIALSQIPVYVVPCRKGTYSRVLRSKRPVQIIALTDFSDKEEKLFHSLQVQFVIYPKRETTFHLLHVIEDLLVASYHLTLGSDAEEIWREREEIMIDKLEAVRDKYFPGKPILTTAIRQSGSIADSVLDFSSNHQASLIVIGKHKRKGIDKLVLGSVAQKVVRYTDRPVLIIPL
jgi:nucleotide-binding universal stress UspA family protein